jgi:phosphohistidine phosphatase
MTSRTLVLLRHAKAERPDRYPKDIDRPLSARGRVDAAAAGRWLAGEGIVPDLVLCSPSVRTRQTWESAGPALGDVPVVYEALLYIGGVDETLELVHQTEATVSTVLVIGHNPTLSILSSVLDPGGSAGDGLHTAGLAVHRLDGAWPDFAAHSGALTLEYTARGTR